MVVLDLPLSEALGAAAVALLAELNAQNLSGDLTCVRLLQRSNTVWSLATLVLNDRRRRSLSDVISLFLDIPRPSRSGSFEVSWGETPSELQIRKVDIG